MWHFGFRPSSLCAAELGKHWYLRKVLLLSSSGLTCLSWQSCHWPALASKSNFFPASELLYIFDSHHKFSRSLQLSKILFSQNTFCDHSLQSNRVSSHQPLLCMVCFIQNTYHSKILLSVFTRFSSLSSVCHLKEGVTEFGHCFFASWFLFSAKYCPCHIINVCCCCC